MPSAGILGLAAAATDITVCAGYRPVYAAAEHRMTWNRNTDYSGCTT